MTQPDSSENLQQRVGFLATLPALLRRWGADPSAALLTAGLHPGALDNPESKISYAAASRLFQLSAEITGCPHFGLELARPIRSASLGILGELMRTGPTLGVALKDFAANQHRHAHGGIAYLVADQHRAFFGYAIYQPNMPGYELICDFAALVAFNLVCELTSPATVPVSEILFSRAKPQDLGPYQRAFGVPLRFDVGQTAVVLARTTLERQVAGSSAADRRAIVKRIAAHSTVGDLDTLTHLRRTLRVALVTGKTSSDEVATQLGMSRRTLHRRLSKDGHGFQGVLDETRSAYSRQLLSHTGLGIAEVGLMVGCADPSVFTRTFTRWTGMPPSEWRTVHSPRAKAESA